MPTFTDTKGHTWDIHVTAGTIRRVQRLLDVDLGDLASGTPPLLPRLEVDDGFLVDVLYCVLKPLADNLAVDDQAFAERLDGEALSLAHTALMESLADFFRGRGRLYAVAAIDRQAATTSEAIRRAVDAINSPQMDRTLQNRLDEIRPTPGKPVASALPSPASDPSPTP